MEENDKLVELIRGNYSHIKRAPEARKRPLNDNEKASTFIGWAPDQPCMGGMLNSDGMCEHNNYGTCDQFATAPDMRIPNNYMWALVRLAGKYTFQLNNVLNSDKWLATIWSEIPDNKGEGLEPSPFFGDGTPAGCVIEMLASIYDYEQREGK